jgi:hypothetical protein
MSCLYLAGFGEGHAAIITPRELGVARVPVQQQAAFVAAVARIATEHDCPVALQVKGPAWSLKPFLESEGVRVVDVGFDDFVQAGVDWSVALGSGELTHGDDPDLNAAAASAQWRTVNDRQVLSRKNGEIAALEAAVLARAAALSLECDPSAYVI